MYQFIVKRTLNKGTRTYKFNSKEEGFDFLTKHGLDHRIIDVL